MLYPFRVFSWVIFCLVSLRWEGETVVSIIGGTFPLSKVYIRLMRVLRVA